MIQSPIKENVERKGVSERKRTFLKVEELGPEQGKRTHAQDHAKRTPGFRSVPACDGAAEQVPEDTPKR